MDTITIEARIYAPPAAVWAASIELEALGGQVRVSVTMLTVVVATACSASAHQQRHSLVGAWKLVEWRDQDSLGVWHEEFGSEPRGLFVYGENGSLSIQLMHEDGAEVEDCEPGSEELDADMAALGFLVLPRCYVGYFGTYRIEPGDSVVVHLVEGGTIRSYIGTEQPRRFEVRGDSLWIETSDTVNHLLLRVD